MLKSFLKYLCLFVVFIFMMPQIKLYSNNLTARLDSAFSLRNNKPTKGIVIVNEILQNPDIFKDTLTYIKALKLRSILYKKTRQYDYAIEDLIAALEPAKEKNLVKEQCDLYNNIGTVYQSNENYLKSLENYKKSLRLAEGIADKGIISIRYYNIGAVYEALDSLSIAETYYHNSLLIERELKNWEGIYFALYGLGGLETKRNNYEIAETYLKEASKVSLRLNNLRAAANILFELGNLNMKQNKIKEAVSQFQKSVLYCDSSNYSELKANLFKSLSAGFEQASDYKKALEYLKQYIEIEKDINNIEIAAKIEEVTSKFKLKLKEKEIEVLKTRSSVQEIQHQHNRKIRLYLTLLIVSGFSLFIVVYLRHKKNTNA